MAAGDVTVFDVAKVAMLNGTHDLDTNVFKMALLAPTVAPTVSDAQSVSMYAGTSTYTEVTAGGNYVAGGGAVTMSVTQAAGVTKVAMLTPSPFVLTSNAANPTNIAWGLIYNDTSAGKEAIGFVEIAAAGFDGSNGTLTINWAAGGLFTIT